MCIRDRDRESKIVKKDICDISSAVSTCSEYRPFERYMTFVYIEPPPSNKSCLIKYYTQGAILHLVKKT